MQNKALYSSTCQTSKLLPWIWCCYWSADFPSWTPSRCPGSLSPQGRRGAQWCAGCWRGTGSGCVGTRTSGWAPWCHWLVAWRNRNPRLLHESHQWQKAGDEITRPWTRSWRSLLQLNSASSFYLCAHLHRGISSDSTPDLLIIFFYNITLYQWCTTGKVECSN